jgi:DUF2934 family protein
VSSASSSLYFPPAVKRWELEVTVTPVIEGVHPTSAAHEYAAVLRSRREAYGQWESESTHFSSSNDAFDTALNTAIGDFHALQISISDKRIIAAASRARPRVRPRGEIHSQTSDRGHQEITQRAYQLYEARWREHGRDLDDGLQAESEILVRVD